VQAEDGIRDRNVTGVQTCALPISREIRTSVLIISWLVLTSCSRSLLYNPAGVLCLFWRLHGSPGPSPGYPRSVRTVRRVPNLVSSFQQDPLARAVPLVVVVDLVGHPLPANSPNNFSRAACATSAASSRSS